MNAAVITTTEKQYPQCTEFFCDAYLTLGNIIGVFIILFRFSITILILILGTKMDKDFLRSITTAIFLPIVFFEAFNIYTEAATFAALFCTSAAAAKEHQKMYIVWTEQFIIVIYDYIHYNCMVLMVLMLHCCRLAYKDRDMINPFPINTICLVLQIIPFFLCILIYMQGDQTIAFKIISIVSRLVTIGCFLGITIQLICSCFMLTQLLPYDHANQVDMQLRDARSRLAWVMVYMIIPYMALIPFLVESITWISVMGITANETLQGVQVVTELLKILIHYYRPTWLVVLTMLCLPPYRRAVPLLLCCCGFCPKLSLEPLPRKSDDTLMYRYAD